MNRNQLILMLSVVIFLGLFAPLPGDHEEMTSSTKPAVHSSQWHPGLESTTLSPDDTDAPGENGDPLVTSIPPASGGQNGKGDADVVCETQYTTFRCLDDGKNTFYGPTHLYAFPIINRSCLFANIVFDRSVGKFVFYGETGHEILPRVTLSSRAFDLPAVNRGKYRKVFRKMLFSHDWAPEVRKGPIPCSLKRDNRNLAYYSPIVAPWNYAHTLFCDLFGLFWAMWEFGIVRTDWQIVALGKHYRHDFPLPNARFKSFRMFSKLPPVYETVSLPTAVFPKLLCGIGTKTWSWVTPEYRASGSPQLWFDFRRHIINVTGAKDAIDSSLSYDEAIAATPRMGGGSVQEELKKQPSEGSRKVRVSICHKKDKRGIVNYDETVAALRSEYPNVDFVLEGAVGKEAKDQVQMMIDADVYMCNEGTLGTTFFLMPPGSAFVSIQLVFHHAHLHQRHMGPAEHWWKAPDMMRPDPRKKVGGNIDWFPPAIPWVKAFHYDAIPLKETKIQLPLRSLRNYMPEMNIVMASGRIVPLMGKALAWVQRGQVETSANYGISADLCRQILQLTPSLTRSFNSGKCYVSMSWLCEMYANTKYEWRFLHEKWRKSRGHCGDNRSSPLTMGLYDPREERPMEEYLYFTREQLAKSYTTTDMGSHHRASEEELDAVFPPPAALEKWRTTLDERKKKSAMARNGGAGGNSMPLVGDEGGGVPSMVGGGGGGAGVPLSNDPLDAVLASENDNPKEGPGEK